MLLPHQDLASENGQQLLFSASRFLSVEVAVSRRPRVLLGVLRVRPCVLGMSRPTSVCIRLLGCDCHNPTLLGRARTKRASPSFYETGRFLSQRASFCTSSIVCWNVGRLRYWKFGIPTPDALVERVSSLHDASTRFS